MPPLPTSRRALKLAVDCNIRVTVDCKSIGFTGRGTPRPPEPPRAGWTLHGYFTDAGSQRRTGWALYGRRLAKAHRLGTLRTGRLWGHAAQGLHRQQPAAPREPAQRGRGTCAPRAPPPRPGPPCGIDDSWHDELRGLATYMHVDRAAARVRKNILVFRNAEN